MEIVKMRGQATLPGLHTFRISGEGLKFVQETRALPLCNGGLGVGLSIARDLVEAHGGTVVGASAGKDCGSEFVVTLPLADLHVPAQVN